MIDLHIHSNHSDGTDSVEKLLEKAEEKRLEIISITDHDCIDAYYELESQEIRNTFSGKIITGVELCTSYNKVPIEILGYKFDYKKLKIHKIDQQTIQSDILEKYKKIAKDIGLKLDENLRIDQNDNSKKYASFAFGWELLKYKENIPMLKKIGEEFKPETFYRVHQSNVDSIFYFDETIHHIDINETIDRIHEAGGLAFLAHGYIYPFKNKDSVIEEILRDTKIDGLECMYSTFTKEESKKAMELCKKYNKYMSGGSDYHGLNKPSIELGNGTENNLNIDKKIIENWRS